MSLYCKGINEGNVQDVKWCISKSSWEKRSRAAASKLFRKICLEDRKLTPSEYKKRVKEISQSSLEKKLLEKGKAFNVIVCSFAISAC